MSEIFTQLPALAEFAKIYSVSNLPQEIINNILSYSYEIHPLAKLMKNELKYYENDHNYDLTRHFKLFYCKSYYSFYEYYFIRMENPYDYDSYYERKMDLKMDKDPEYAAYVKRGFCDSDEEDDNDDF